MSNFQELSLDGIILSTLDKIGFKVPTPVQTVAIPKVIQGLDIVVSAQTGTGKTGAFLLPAIQLLTKLPKVRSPRILILAPTRELAMQITKEAEKFSKDFSKMKTVCIYGGVPYPKQRRDLSRPYEILVATPGRLMDHMRRGIIDLSKIKMLILDEADRMLDMGFLDPVIEIAKACPESRQTLLFSATIDKKILQISKSLQKNPEEIRIEPEHTTHKNIEQRLFLTDNLMHKMKLLNHFLENESLQQAIIFTSTKRQADIIAERLKEEGRLAEALHGDMNQRQRTRVVQALRKNRINIIVATDVAARGIDIPTLNLVINLDLPFKPEDYVHRIGRTGRAGAKGSAITLVSHQDKVMMDKIQKLLGSSMDFHIIEGLEPQKKIEKKSFKQRPFKQRKRFSQKHHRGAKNRY